MLETDDEFVRMLRDAHVAAGTSLSLCVSAYEVANAGAQPVPGRDFRHTGEAEVSNSRAAASANVAADCCAHGMLPLPAMI